MSVDKGYRGHRYQGKGEVHMAGKKVKTRKLKRLLKRRNAIEQRWSPNLGQPVGLLKVEFSVHGYAAVGFAT